MTSVAVSIRQRVVAFEAPLHERRALRDLKHSVSAHTGACASAGTDFKFYGSVAIAHAGVFQFLTFLLSSKGSTTYPDETQQLLSILFSVFSTKIRFQALPRQKFEPKCRWEDANACYVVAETRDRPRHCVFVLLTYRPQQLLPLYMASARRAVKFVNAVVALVTANAYVSTLGGGHFLCRHLNHSTLLAKLQIGISMGLQDPILESKCRVNLMYNALQLGKFKRAKRILRREELVAEQLESDELLKVCHAANVYLDKVDQLHKEQLLVYRKSGRPATLHDNFYRQRIVRVTK
uniref:RxLR effector candidate protein n=2 Tax=Hyaloperonospora arabidopsidis (strain Emoy2) TaxID=559515 RepID=M4BZR7_HYAAE|nr:RxLR effector candidate protein [Hyaloperonospora arabidopsidis Emoy2]